MNRAATEEVKPPHHLNDLPNVHTLRSRGELGGLDKRDNAVDAPAGPPPPHLSAEVATEMSALSEAHQIMGRGSGTNILKKRQRRCGGRGVRGGRQTKRRKGTMHVKSQDFKMTCSSHRRKQRDNVCY